MEYGDAGDGGGGGDYGSPLDGGAPADVGAHDAEVVAADVGGSGDGDAYDGGHGDDGGGDGGGDAGAGADGDGAAENGEPQPASVSLKVDSVKPLFDMLSAIYNGKKDTYAVIAANKKGLRSSVENAAKNMFAACLMKIDLFTSFDLPPVRGPGTEIRFKVALSSLLECLSVYGADKLPLTAAHIAYAEDDGKLNLLLEAHGVTTECQLATADYARGDDTDHEAAFRGHPVAAKAVVTSEVLHDAIREATEQPGATSASLTMAPTEPFFRLHTYGNLGACTVDVAANSDAFTSWECGAAVTHSYYLPLLQASLRSLAASDMSFLRINSEGMLHLANKVVTDSTSAMFVTFLFMPDELLGGGDEAADGGGGASQDVAATGGPSAGVGHSQSSAAPATTVPGRGAGAAARRTAPATVADSASTGQFAGEDEAGGATEAQPAAAKRRRHGGGAT